MATARRWLRAWDSARTICALTCPSNAAPQVCRTSSYPSPAREALDQAQPGPGLIAALHDAERQTGAYLFVPPSADNLAQVSARMFAQGMGIVEDAATGSAAGPLGAYLTRHGLVPLEDGQARITVMQGERMGRPSRLVVTVEQHDDAISEVRVGGEAVVVAQGDLLLPDLPANA